VKNSQLQEADALREATALHQISSEKSILAALVETTILKDDSAQIAAHKKALEKMNESTETSMIEQAANIKGSERLLQSTLPLPLPFFGGDPNAGASQIKAQLSDKSTPSAKKGGIFSFLGPQG
jgi:hypothetical protein